jgi:hypothetical protein
MNEQREEFTKSEAKAIRAWLCQIQDANRYVMALYSDMECAEYFYHMLIEKEFSLDDFNDFAWDRFGCKLLGVKTEGEGNA